ncbi:hypothetical protein B1H58_19185 [Pantoea alhagi]|uniref:Biofilm development protein YmgB/AriR n=1 Tax=Pantoea alhagi TaxID=1891675 RepID=A0A1W6BA60_9GAMM|nr:biofilm development regulator YmgB/AriR family protein [Pantoea alhagi]ARJ43964.1 hypothetical protein B1H58_19185 [Pantoea alhagi]
MNQEQAIEKQIVNYFKQSATKESTNEEVLRTLMEKIATKTHGRSEKKIIASLLEKIETEHDRDRLQFYRQALELLLRGGRN